MARARPDEFWDGVFEGRYVFLEIAWGVPARWTGVLVAFRSDGEKFGVVSKSSTTWRCYLGNAESNGMYGRTWWQEQREMIVEDFGEASAHIDEFLAAPDA